MTASAQDPAAHDARAGARIGGRAGARTAGARAGARRAGGPAIPVFLYHAVMDDPPDWIAEFTVTPRAFAAHLDAVVDSGRTPVTISALADHLAGRAPLPPRPVLLTFDDGYSSVATGAAPLLKELGIPAVVFLVSTQVGGTNAWDVDRGAAPLPLLDADEVRELLGQGWEVGSHSRTHAHLAGLDRQQLEKEVSGSRDELTRMGLPVPRLLAYPYGEHHLAVRRAARRAGYTGAFALDGTGTGDRFALSRLEVQRGEDPAALVSRVQSAAPSRSTLQARRELRGAVQLVLGGHGLRRSRSGPV
jgi:peptidoglycan/xylan/chitin deacetylase (PgdA/CDA1 family)